MIGKEQIAEVVRYLDAESEEFEDMPRFWGKRGVDVTGLTDVAMQRGLRVVRIRRGRSPNVIQPTKVPLNRAQQKDMIHFASTFMDGFAAGWEARGKHDGHDPKP